MPQTQSSQIALSVNLLKGSATPKNALKDASALEHHVVKDGAAKIADLYLARPAVHPPRWHGYVSKFVPGLPGLTNRTNSAVMLVPAAGRLFAVTFGYGRGLLAPDICEDSFGLRVTLNAVPDDGLRTIGRKTLDAFAHHTHTQAISAGRLPQFGVDLEQDLLQAVTGTPGDTALGLRLVGKDSLGVLTKASPADLPALFGRYVREFTSTAYRQKYPEIDQMAEEQDPAVVSKLEDVLLQKIIADDLERIWLAVPELITWETIEGFRYRQAGPATYIDLHFKEFLEHVRDPSTLTATRLKQKYAFAVDGQSHNAAHQWSIFKCIHAEVTLGQDNYVLSGAKWFRLDRNFVRKVDRAIDQLPHTTLRLPASVTGESEQAYNKRAAKAIAGCTLMDRATVTHGGGHSSIEFCDLFTKQRQMIHVKKYAGSGVLSHLFNQGSNAAEMLARDQDFRGRVRSKLPTPHRALVTLEPVNPANYEVIYGIIGRPRRTKRLSELLPFFSRVTLRRAAHRLQGQGFKVSIAWISP